jgi:hypothetical protein
VIENDATVHLGQWHDEQRVNGKADNIDGNDE